MKPSFFATPSKFRAWLEKNHDKKQELWVGFYKTSSGKPSITWSEAVDQALCFGWIDGIRKSVDDISYTNRFTPRQRRSNWSLKNVKRVEELSRLGLMHPAGLEAFEARSKTATYSYENRHEASLDDTYERQFRKNRKAWSFFDKQPPSYRTTAIWWVMSAKKEETRARRLAMLVEHSERGQRVPPLTSPAQRARRA